MKDWEEYRDTGMLGAYHPENAVLRQMEEGNVATIFRDTVHRQGEAGVTRERSMLIHGRVFRVTSVFPVKPAATPTEKLLSLIDSELEKERHSA